MSNELALVDTLAALKIYSARDRHHAEATVQAWSQHDKSTEKPFVWRRGAKLTDLTHPAAICADQMYRAHAASSARCTQLSLVQLSVWLRMMDSMQGYDAVYCEHRTTTGSTRRTLALRN